MTTITATCILKSQHAERPEHTLSTVLCRYPRWIHAEVMTHRAFSRNASSSRAIPIKKQIAAVRQDPAIPLFWGKNQPGMQAYEECHNEIHVDFKRFTAREAWLYAMSHALEAAEAFEAAGYHKQIVTRLIEPFSHIITLISATEWANFFALRIHKDAEPHIYVLAQAIKRALAEAPVQTLESGQWHLPFVHESEARDLSISDRVKVSVARCASTSYRTVDDKEMTVDRATELHDKLVSQKPVHASPAEHVAQADKVMFYNEWRYPERHRNFRGFSQYRAMLPHETVR